MAGSSPFFDATAFRTNIVNTMEMGLNSEDFFKPTFYFAKTNTWPDGTILDVEGRPVDARVQATVTQPDPVEVPCAVEFVSDTTDGEDLVGTYRQTRAIVTLLDTQFELVQHAIEVRIDGHLYNINDLHTVALFDVNVYQLMCFRKGVDE